MNRPEQRPSVLLDETGQRYHVISASEARAVMWGAIIDALDRFKAEQGASSTAGQQPENVLDPHDDTSRSS
ncbi:hypothetical protein [Roseovarius sp.]|uniref:hypothetical protein n=1 Tax=Roseovarius sp. TaxID=1486281 RepID=UPI003BAB0EC9